jgi:AraC-like DNA-binding protein
MDALSKVLETVKFKGIIYNKLEFSAPWGINVTEDYASQFWRLLSGKCVLQVPGEPLLELAVGDLVYVPHGSSHWIAGHASHHRVPALEFRQARDSGHPLFVGQEEPTVLLGGHFEFDMMPNHPFLTDLPNVIHVSHYNTEVSAWLRQTANLIFEEVTHPKPGSEVILGRLAEVAFVHIIRAYLEEEDNAKGFLLALQDERISKALQLMQTFPEKDWSLDTLSSQAGMSRSLFCSEFKRMVGETPLSYLTNWRIIKARELLATTKGNISEVAIDVGYQSEAAFNRIYKKKTGETPARYRRTKLNA